MHWFDLHFFVNLPWEWFSPLFHHFLQSAGCHFVFGVVTLNLANHPRLWYDFVRPIIVVVVACHLNN